MNSIDLIRPQLNRIQSLAMPIGIVGLILTVIGFFISPATFFPVYLVAFMLWFGVTLGSIAWLLIHHVAGSGAFFLIRRLLEAGARNLPMMAILFVPIALTTIVPSLHFYPWTDAAHVAGDHVLEFKSPYLNVPFWLMRAVFYFAVWFVTLVLLLNWGKKQAEGDLSATHKLSMWGAVGLLMYVFTVTFAAFDWVMSLTPHWFSSLFGVIFIVGQGLSTLCLMHVMITKLTEGTALTDFVPQRYFRDLGNMTLAFTLLWAYTNFSQYVIIWSGNIGEEASWYVPRIQTNWVIIGGFLIACHFALPFLTLLSSSVKVRIQNLAKLALWILLMRYIDMNFYITATFAPNLFGNAIPGYTPVSPQLGSANWLAGIGSMLGMGGLWMWAWARNLKQSPDLLAAGDPRFVGQYELPESATDEPSNQGVVAHG